MTIRCRECSRVLAEANTPPGTIVRAYALCNDCQPSLIAEECSGCMESQLLLGEAPALIKAIRPHVQDLSFRSDAERNLAAIDQFLSKAQGSQRRGGA